MKDWLKIGLAAALGIAVLLPVSAGADDIGKKMVDPVAKKEVTVAKDTPRVIVNSTKIYFVDAKSRETFLKNPETYLATPVECPVRGLKGKANKANRLVVNDQILYFCCAGCSNGFQKEPNNFLSNLVDPVSGKEFSLSACSPKVTHQGGLYFFESDECKAAFEKEPAKYAKVVLQ